MTLTERVLKLYQAEALRTGSYLAARQAVIAQLKLPAARVDRILATGGQG